MCCRKDDGKGRTLGCPTQLAEPYLSRVDPSKYNCRCSTAPWGQLATQLLTPNATQVTRRLVVTFSRPPATAALTASLFGQRSTHVPGLTTALTLRPAAVDTS